MDGPTGEEVVLDYTAPLEGRHTLGFSERSTTAGGARYKLYIGRCHK